MNNHKIAATIALIPMFLFGSATFTLLRRLYSEDFANMIACLVLTIMFFILFCISAKSA